MYSPGMLNCAVVAAFPSLSTGGLGFSNVTEPGPRNLLQNTLAGGPCRGRASGGCFPSSSTQTVSGAASPALAINESAIPRGGPVNVGPPGLNVTTGGVLPTPASLYGSTIHRGFKLIGMEVVFSFAVMVHVSFLSPKSFGTVTGKKPHCL